MGLSGGEIFLVVLVALMLFGAKSIPDIAKGMGKAMKEFKKAADEIKDELNKSSDGSLGEIRQIKNDLEQAVNEHLPDVPSITNPIDEIKQDLNNTINRP
ncbi:MAG: twin-arginine translocase TatA/TatE family subunit [Bacteroidales bacterium]